jgi:hypothetical protein
MKEIEDEQQKKSKSMVIGRPEEEAPFLVPRGGRVRRF